MPLQSSFAFLLLCLNLVGSSAVEAVVVCLVGILSLIPGAVSGRPSARMRAYEICSGLVFPPRWERAEAFLMRILLVSVAMVLLPCFALHSLAIATLCALRNLVAARMASGHVHHPLQSGRL